MSATGAGGAQEHRYRLTAKGRSTVQLEDRITVAVLSIFSAAERVFHVDSLSLRELSHKAGGFMSIAQDGLNDVDQTCYYATLDKACRKAFWQAKIDAFMPIRDRPARSIIAAMVNGWLEMVEPKDEDGDIAMSNSMSALSTDDAKP